MEVHSVQHLGSGWERDVFLINDRLVVHFPRYAGVAEGLARHEAILEFVDSSVGRAVTVPRISIWGRASEHFPHAFFGHEVIPGVEADPMDAAAAPELASDLGEALSRIHAIPAASARELGISVDLGDCQTAFRDLMRQVDVVNGLEEVVPESCEWLLGPPIIPNGYAGPHRFLHNDLHPEHVIVEPGSGRLAGIIDWSGVALGDPSVDFSFLLLLHGRKFLDRALAAYGLPIDDEFLNRTIFRARVRGLGWLVYALHRQADLARSLREVENTFSQP
ncbi:MAG: phosphotransferase family protein [Longimicrobiales bacterium]